MVNQNEQIVTTKKAVMDLVEKFPEAKQYVEILYPQVFEDNTVFTRIGDLFLRKNYPNAVYTILKQKGIVQIVNITASAAWGIALNTDELKDRQHIQITVSEFKRLWGNNSIEDAIMLPNVGGKQLASLVVAPEDKW